MYILFAVKCAAESGIQPVIRSGGHSSEVIVNEKIEWMIAFEYLYNLGIQFS